MFKYVCIAIVSNFLSALSQIFFKKAALKEYRSLLKEYLNFYVIFGYMITGVCMILAILAFRGMPYKYGSVIEALNYCFIMLLSRLLLKEQFTPSKIKGNALIIIGIMIFSLGN